MARYVIWIDRAHARVFTFDEAAAEPINLHFTRIDHHTHHKENEDRESPRLYEEVAEHLRDASELLIVGPGVGKVHFQRHLEAKHPALAKSVVGCENMGHPTDGELHNYARRYFHRVEQLNGQP